MRRRTAFEMCVVIFLMASVLFACLWQVSMSRTVLIVGGVQWFIVLIAFVITALRLKSTKD